MPADNVHLLVLVHGMWGNPVHLKSVHRMMSERRCQADSETGPAGERLEILLAETNRDEHTYDGIDWGGERVAEEVYDTVKRLADEGRKVTRFSIAGYSLGGLVSRYVVGILHQRKFFEDVTPVNFNTFATPHIGLHRYRSFISSVAYHLGPTLMSRTGQQLYTLDKWSARDRPLLEVMADPNRIFYQGLSLFQHLRIYANAVNDITVPYPTAAIEAHDPFFDHMHNGIEIELDEEYPPLIKSYQLPSTPPPPPPSPKPFTRSWFKSFSVPLPPMLQFKFPYSILIYSLLPILLPLLMTLVLTRLSLATLGSRKRLRLLERDETSVDRLIHILGKLERDVEDAVADVIDAPGSASPALSDSPGVLALATNSESAPASRDEAQDTQLKAEAGQVVVQPMAPEGEPQQLVLSDLQLRLVRLLNTLPGLRKERAYIHPVRNTHGIIICRDVQMFPSHKLGEGVLRHWAEHWIV